VSALATVAAARRAANGTSFASCCRNQQPRDFTDKREVFERRLADESSMMPGISRSRAARRI